MVEVGLSHTGDSLYGSSRLSVEFIWSSNRCGGHR